MRRPSLWGNAGPLVVGRAVSAVVGVALPVILARKLDAPAYGTYKQIYLIAFLAMYCLQFGLSQSLFYFVPRAATDDERRACIGQTQLLLFGIGVLTFLGIDLAAPAIARRFSNPELGDLAVPIALLSAALVASSAFEIALTARGKPASSAAALIGTDLTRVAAMLSAIELGYGLRGLAWAAALSAVVRWIAALALGGSRGRFALRRDLLARQFAYSLPFGAAVLLLNQQQQLHQIFVAARTSPALFALYAVGCMQVPVVSLLYAPVSETLQVQLALLERTGETHRAGEIFAVAVDRLATVFLPLCAVLVVTARPGLHVLYGGRYDGAANVLRIAVLSVAVASLPLDGVLKARARTGLLLAMYAAKLAVTWPALALGFRLGGLEGAIGAHVCVELATRVVQLKVVAWDLAVPALTLVGGRRLFGSLKLAAAVALAAAAMVALVPRALPACVAAGAAGFAIVAWDWNRRRKGAAWPEALRQPA